MNRWTNLFDRLTRGVDLMAGLSLAIVTILIFFSAIGRYFLSFPIPESFDISRFLLGASVMWGFAVLGYSGKHITVDLLAEAVSPKWQRAIDVFAQLVVFAFTLTLAWKMLGRLETAYSQNESTFELRLHVWPFLALIWAGVFAACFTTAARLILLLTNQVSERGEEMNFYE